MLRSLDILIGFVTVLLVLSLAVTMLTQIVANFLRLRSRHLREGVLDVFRQLGWGFVGDGAEILARRVVRSKDAITREDLIETADLAKALGGLGWLRAAPCTAPSWYGAAAGSGTPS